MAIKKSKNWKAKETKIINLLKRLFGEDEIVEKWLDQKPRGWDKSAREAMNESEKKAKEVLSYVGEVVEGNFS